MSILITAPVDIECGYGRKSREIVAPIAEKYWEETDIAFLNWGNNPKADLTGTDYEFLMDKKGPINLESQPDLHIHIGLPTEFETKGVTNIIFTSGAEVDRISYKWIQKINKDIDLVIVPSNFIANVFKNTTYQDASGKELKVNKPIMVVPESYSNNLFDKMSDEERTDIDDKLSHITESSWFVTYGQITPRNVTGEERKNISTLIEKFLEEFRGNKDVALILKCNGVNFSNHAYYQVEQYVRRIVNETCGNKDGYPSVYLLEGYLTDPQLFHLMTHDNVVSHVTTTHGEGFGRFLLEASLTEKPIIIPKVGSYRDFLYGKSIEMMEVDWVSIPKTAVFGDTIVREAQWVNMKDGEIRKALSNVYKNHKKMDGKDLAKANKKDFHMEKVFDLIIDIIDDNYSREVQIKIPEIPED